MADEYILAVDVGGTLICAEICNQHGKCLARSSLKLPFITPESGYVEVVPEVLWRQFCDSIRDVFQKSGLGPTDVTGFGITAQRGTFITWHRSTGEPFHNFYSWLDTRAEQIAKRFNASWSMKVINFVGAVLYPLTRMKKMLLWKALTCDSKLASMKLVWVLENIPEARQAMHEGLLAFGTVDSWLLWKLTKGGVHLTDFSFALGSGMWDPFVCDWTPLAKYVFGIDPSVNPECVDSVGHVCTVHEEIFGAEMPVTAMVGDVSACLFGMSCFKQGEMMCCLGTGSFLSCVTMDYAHASLSGLYPAIGWSYGGDVVRTCEGHAKGIAASVDWAGRIGLFDDVSQSSDIAKSVPDTDGVVFVPAFFGLQVPHMDERACGAFLGIKCTTTKAHLLRAVLEAIAFKICDLHSVFLEEMPIPFQHTVKVCGGVSNNDFVMEVASSLINCTLVREESAEMAVRGAAYLAGIGAGVWKSKEEVAGFFKVGKSFSPDASLRQVYAERYKLWRKAVQRCLKWYPATS